MNDLNIIGSVNDSNIREEQMKKLGYESITTIAEQTFNARMIIRKTDGTEEVIDGNDKIDEFLKTHFQN
jgi:hypothetical protein